MGASRSNTSLLQLALTPLGNERDYRRLVTVPQTLVFVILFAIEGLTARATPSLLLARGIGVLFVLLADLVVVRAQFRFLPRLLALHLAVVTLVLIASAQFLDLSAGFGVLLPLALLILSLLTIKMPWQVVLPGALLLMLATGAYWFLLVYPAVQRHEITGGCALLVLAAWAVFVRSLLPRSLAPVAEAAAQRMRLASAEAETQKEAAEDVLQRERLTRLYRRIFVEEFLSECAGRLPFVSSVLAATVLFEVLHDGGDGAVFRGGWLSVAIAQFGLMVLLFLRTDTRGLEIYGVCSAITGLLWVWLFSLLVGDAPLAGFLLFVFAVVAYGALPWSYQIASLFVTSAGGMLAGFCASGMWPAVYAALGLLVVVVAFRAAVVTRLSFMTRIGSTFFARCCEFSPSAWLTLKMLVAQLKVLGSCDRLLVCFGNQQARRVHKEEWTPLLSDNLYLRGILQKIEASNREEGVLRYKELGHQFMPVLLDWFAKVPARMFFVRLTAVLDGKETGVVIILPVSMEAQLAGLNKVFRGIAGIASIGRLSLAMARSRFLSSDILLATERSVSEREQELNRVIHNVNNVAQDIAIHCEQVRRLVQDGVAPNDGVKRSDSIVEGIEKMEAAARALSAGTSDVKLLTELMRVKEFRHVESVEVASLVEEAQSYAQYLSYRKGQKFSVQNSLAGAAGVKVVSREFLEAVLRLCLRIACGNVSKDGSVALSVSEESDFICFEVADDGEPIDAGIKNKITGAAHDGIGTHAGRSELLILKAAVNLARLSSGKFEFRTIDGKALNCCRLSLPKAVITSVADVQTGQWALLVDDNAEVTTFYSRVAEALGFKYFTAASVIEAEGILKGHGKPRLVITDIQLGEGSGLDLVRSIRSQFGVELPVIVVSGNNDNLTEEMARGAGATKFLAKPVGRRKLFSEIQGIL